MAETQGSIAMGRFLAKCTRRHAKEYYALHPEAPTMCPGCAFKEGTEANRDEITLLAVECLASPQSLKFMCHHDLCFDLVGNSIGPKQLCAGYRILKWAVDRPESAEEGGAQ